MSHRPIRISRISKNTQQLQERGDERMIEIHQDCQLVARGTGIYNGLTGRVSIGVLSLAIAVGCCARLTSNDVILV